jgi:hypothetical protein
VLKLDFNMSNSFSGFFGFLVEYSAVLPLPNIYCCPKQENPLLLDHY